MYTGLSTYKILFNVHVGAQAISRSDRFGRSSGVVWLRNVNCSGTENNLTRCIQNVSLQSSFGCAYLGIGDAGISCQAGELICKKNITTDSVCNNPFFYLQFQTALMEMSDW